MYIIDGKIKKGHETWSNQESKHVKTKDSIVQFLREYEDLCRKHNISLSHEDGHGAFIFQEFDEDNIDWVCYGQDDI